jgi:hypothetical protein
MIRHGRTCPAIHVFGDFKEGVDARHKAGHDKKKS